MKLYTDKENERSMAVIPRLFSPSSSKNLLSFPSSYDSSLKPPTLLQISISFSFTPQKKISPLVSIFYRKPLPAPLLLHSASMAPLTTSMADLDLLLPPIWLPPAEKGAPTHLS